MPDRFRGSTVRLSDVARLAQCSAATVSRVLNAPDSVNRDARLRVEAAVLELGYTRNGAARALRLRRSRIIGLILPTLRQPIDADFVGSLQDTLGRRDHALIVTTCGYSSDQELFQARLLSERGVDGLVLIGHRQRPELYTLMQAQGLPFVTTYTFRPESQFPMVGFDNGAAMRQVVEHLVDLGHRDIAILAGVRSESDRVEERVSGAIQAMRRRGGEIPPERIAEADFTFEGGRAGLRRILARLPAPPTALICTSDVLAYGAIIECKAQRISVPGRMSIVGFDDLQASAHVLPPLTSLAIPSEEIGRKAADYLLERLDGRDVPSQISIATRLSIRGTTAPPSTETPADMRQG